MGMGLMLMEICPKCVNLRECNETPPHPYNNTIWHSCLYKKQIVDGLGGLRDSNPIPPKDRPCSCDKCHVRKTWKDIRTFNAVRVCLKCYPRSEYS